ncbi:S-adenosyl-L-methionine-dependent methyltransferase [Tribonema minus]|uniref:S-adenosyl-L-methionine-dependent methyltransferase n=1 Tax=Tribonema minus TaxID=303371 RepID=A0A835YU37_9STRA|nr:S-adenosyl-L-methionine-dependent methyltransferase [Tribonema minus]
MPSSSTKPSSDAVKGKLLEIFGVSNPQNAAAAGEYDEVLASPAGAKPVREAVRLFGPAGALRYMIDADGRRWRSNGVYTDFVGDDAKAPWDLSRSERIMEGTFQSPLVSFVYERGWRQAFNANGFPGIDKEFEEVAEFFSPVQGPSSVVMDLSCGSGLMTRRLVKSNRYGRVIAGDLSPSMLGEAAQRFDKAGLTRPEFLRCDVSQLPIQSGSVDGLHAGAALHCWTQLEAGLREVYRVLKPGGRFYASTFLVAATINTPLNQNGYKFFTVSELERYMREAGFETVTVMQSGRACALIRCVKADNNDNKAPDALAILQEPGMVAVAQEPGMVVVAEEPEQEQEFSAIVPPSLDAPLEPFEE